MRRYGNVVVVPFEKWHMQWVDFNDAALANVSTSDYSIEEQALALECHSHAFTALRDGKVLCCVGVTPLWTGVYELWMYLGKDTFTERRKALRIIREFLDMLVAKHKIHRLQSVVLEDFTEGRRFAKFFGFEEEGEMKNFGPEKETYIRVSKCF
ncbi:MAG TPA: hypothetical protein EYQ21_07280 [Flavobacteriales bacterium]|nr:hypothetical protein [Flavobacteriales bacterium]